MRTAAILLTLATVLGGGALLSADPQQQPEFEVASIKQRTGERVSFTGPISPDRFYRPDVTAKDLVRFAYDLWEFQVAGAPDWTTAERWSVDAKAAGPQRPAEMRALVQTLLVNRFALKAHRETRELAVYDMVLSRRDGSLGENIKPSILDCRPFLDGLRPREESPVDDHGMPLCSNGARWSSGVITPRLNGQPISALSRLLEPMVGRRVIDRTNLQGNFDIELTFADDAIPGMPPLPPGTTRRDGPSLFTALQEQLGIRLEGTRGPVEVLVIDSVERPTPD